ERSVVLIEIKMACRLPTLWEAVKTAAVYEKNIGPAVIVKINEGGAATRSLDYVLLGLLVASLGLYGQTGLLGNIDELNPRGCGRSRHGMFSRILLSYCSRTENEAERKPAS